MPLFAERLGEMAADESAGTGNQYRSSRTLTFHPSRLPAHPRVAARVRPIRA